MSNSFVTLWTHQIHQAPLSMGFPRQESWSGLPFPFSGDLPDPGIRPPFPAVAGGFFITDPPWKPVVVIIRFYSSFTTDRTVHQKVHILLYVKSTYYNKVLSKTLLYPISMYILLHLGTYF